MTNMVKVPSEYKPRQSPIMFAFDVAYVPFGRGFELLNKEHLEALYSDVIAVRPDLKVE